MFKHLYLVLVIWTLAISPVQAKTYIRDYTYEASEADSKITCRGIALSQIQINLLREIGTSISQKINITKDGKGNTYISDDVEATTAGITKIITLEEKWDGETFFLKAQIDVDTNQVLNALKEFKKGQSQASKQQLAIFKKNQRQLKAARDEIERLRKELKTASSQEEKEEIIKAYKDQSTSLLLQMQAGYAENPKVKMETSKGVVILELYPYNAPESVANFLQYVNDGAYDGTIFHRVIKNFMNQGGGFTSDYTKVETRDPIPNEAFNGLKNLKLTVAMARTNSPHSATNQFFINTADNAFLDHKDKSMRGWGYTVFGKVIEGENVVGAITRVRTGPGGPFAKDAPRTPIIIKKATEIKE